MNTKTKILKESLKLFLRKSYKDVTMSEILKATGLSKGAFYYYFKSKEELFHEIIETYFSYMVVYDFEKYSKDSLKDFYEDHLKDLSKAIGKFTSEKSKYDGNSLNINYLYPIFDASRILPVFREEFSEARKKEIHFWTAAVRRARKSGEIKSKMSDDQIARIFIYAGNSIGLQQIIEGGSISGMAEIYKEFWNNFYKSIKT